MKQWSIIQNETQYKAAKERFEEMYQVDKTSPDFPEMSLLALLISQYERKNFSFPPLIPSK
jgi:HTH-type transcriptional regulator / antitoxin HigA